MATSQYLRPAGLLEVTKSYLTPDVVRHASSAIGEPESATRQSLLSAVPAVLSGVTRMASSPQGSSGLATTLREGGFESVVSNPSALFTSGTSASRIAVLGQQLVSRIFGSKSTMVSDAVAKSSGVSTNSANRVLNFAAPLVMGVLSRHVTSQGLNATGLSNLLADQKDEISNATPPGVLRVLDSSGPTMVTSTSSAAAVPKALYREGREEFSQLGRTSSPANNRRWAHKMAPVVVVCPSGPRFALLLERAFCTPGGGCCLATGHQRGKGHWQCGRTSRRGFDKPHLAGRCSSFCASGFHQLQSRNFSREFRGCPENIRF